MKEMLGSRTSLGVLVWSLTVGMPLAATATEPAPAVDGATRATARQLGYEGIQDFQREDYRAATDKLERAYKMLKAPSLALWSARALERSGKFVEAAERYLEATRLPDDAGGEASVQQRSRDEARQDRELLLPRIPTLLIEIEGASPEDVTLSIRGEDVPSAVVGSARPTNPGDAVVEGRFGQQVVKQKVVLVEGEKRSVTLRFQAEPQARAALVEDTPPAGAEPRGPGWQRPVGWAGVGLGAAGIALGAIAGGSALGAQLDDCPGGVCDPSVSAGDISSYNTLLDVSTIGFIAGGVFAAAGITLLLTAPKGSSKSEPSAGLHLTPVLGLSGAALRGTF